MLRNVKLPETSSLSVFCVQRQLRQLYKKWNLYGVFQKWRQDHSLPKKWEECLPKNARVGHVGHFCWAELWQASTDLFQQDQVSYRGWQNILVKIRGSNSWFQKPYPPPQSLTVPPWKVTFPRGKDRPPTTTFLGLCQTSGVYWTLTTQRLRCLSFHFSSLGKVCLARFLKSTFWVHSIAIDTGEKSRPCKTHGLFRWWDGWQTWQKNSIFLVQKNLP